MFSSFCELVLALGKVRPARPGQGARSKHGKSKGEAPLASRLVEAWIERAKLGMGSFEREGSVGGWFKMFFPEVGVRRR